MKNFDRKNNIAFITLTNRGYLDYTKNCIKSIIQCGIREPLKVYCIDEIAYNEIIKFHNNVYLIDDINKRVGSFIEYRTKGWEEVVINKFKIIYKELLSNRYVCFTDGDIVYENKECIKFCLDNIGNNDMIAQREYNELDSSPNNICSGFMLIKSNRKTRKLFNPNNLPDIICDQIYINSIKKYLKYSFLPKELFPNGFVYYKMSNKIKPYLIHFNFIAGDNNKRKKMCDYNKWYL